MYVMPELSISIFQLCSIFYHYQAVIYSLVYRCKLEVAARLHLIINNVVSMISRNNDNVSERSHKIVILLVLITLCVL